MNKPMIHIPLKDPVKFNPETLKIGVNQNIFVDLHTRINGIVNDNLETAISAEIMKRLYDDGYTNYVGLDKQFVMDALYEKMKRDEAKNKKPEPYIYQHWKEIASVVEMVTITDFVENLNYNSVVLDISEINKFALLLALKRDKVNKLYRLLNNTKYLWIENCDLDTATEYEELPEDADGEQYPIFKLQHVGYLDVRSQTFGNELYGYVMEV